MSPYYVRIIAFDRRFYGLGFAVLERSRLIDWGVRNLRAGVNAPRAPLDSKVRELIASYVPDALVLKTTRNARQRTADEIQKVAAQKQIPMHLITPRSVRNVFAACRNKDQIASAVCERFMELRPILPPKRKLWMPEDYRMGIFEATATGIAYFANQNQSSNLILPA